MGYINTNYLIGCPQSYFPLTTVTLTPGRSCVRPPSMRTTLCSCKVCPSFGINAVNSFPFDNLTRQHFLWAEFGFFGFRIIVCSTIPFICGLPVRGPRRRFLGLMGPLRMIWLTVRSTIELVWRGWHLTLAQKTTSEREMRITIMRFAPRY